MKTVYEYIAWPENSEEWDGERNTIQGAALRSFLDRCFENAAYFSLQYARWSNCKNHRLERRLEPFRIRTIETEKWFGYDYTQAPEGDEYAMKINLYRADPLVKAHLLRWMDGIFMEVRKDGKLRPSTQTLEDLCIFSETGILMGSISHEHILVVEPRSEAFLQEIDIYGQWRPCQWENYSGMPIDMQVFVHE